MVPLLLFFKKLAKKEYWCRNPASLVLTITFAIYASRIYRLLCYLRKKYYPNFEGTERNFPLWFLWKLILILMENYFKNKKIRRKTGSFEKISGNQKRGRLEKKDAVVLFFAVLELEKYLPNSFPTSFFTSLPRAAISSCRLRSTG